MLAHALYLERAKSGAAVVQRQQLRAAYAGIRRIVRDALRELPQSVPQRRRVLKQLRIALSKQGRALFDPAKQGFERQVIAFSKAETKWITDLLKQVTRGTPIKIKEARESTVRRKTREDLLDTKLGAWFRKYRDATLRKVLSEVSNGLRAGNTVDELQARVARALTLADHWHMTTVKTAYQHAASAARDTVAIANEAVLQVERWVSVLDFRTSAICIALDGTEFPVGEGEFPPAHARCRSMRVLVFKSAAEVGGDFSEADLDFDGVIPELPTVDEIISNMSAFDQDRLLGKRRGALLRSGRVTSVEELIDEVSRKWIPLRELQLL